MKLRSLLLVACMTTVPLTAMFSHRLPGGLRQSLQRLVWEPTLALVRGTSPDRERKVESMHEPLRPVAAAAPAHGEVSDSVRESDALRARLVQLGAVGVECRPLPGAASAHVAMCRLPVDTTGHLHRVFQATGSDAETAQRRLLLEVEVWLRRTASRAPP